jgi:hypothetical protein
VQGIIDLNSIRIVKAAKSLKRRNVEIYISTKKIKE